MGFTNPPATHPRPSEAPCKHCATSTRGRSLCLFVLSRTYRDKFSAYVFAFSFALTVE